MQNPIIHYRNIAPQLGPSVKRDDKVKPCQCDLCCSESPKFLKNV